ncbi:MAG: hypothetical protein NZ958_01530 [Bacteroidia bacterium]|nr:hypothetical protein [Bacteroidia bacterium]MDW8089346.1 hypothetical protein [Bacteroidia bacterium]
MKYLLVELCMAAQVGTGTDIYGDTAYTQAQRLYFAAVQAETYVDKAVAAFQTLKRRYGEVPVIQAYLYGLLALQARYAFNPFKKAAYFQQAVAGLDSLVNRYPSDPEVRFLRGTFYFYLPSFLGKRAEAQKDISELTDLLLRYSPAYRAKYHPEILKAIIDFLAGTGWVAKEKIAALRKLYGG